MATIQCTIDDLKVTRVKTGVLKARPNNETKDDPNWVDPQDGSEAPQVAKYTDTEWFKELGRRYYVHLFKAGEEKQAKEDAQALLATDQDSLIT